MMLIDLARNDIGRIAKTGSVKVTEAFVVERYSHVMHIVSNVEGILQDGMTSMDVLKATFPAGTLCGAPKVHAMELDRPARTDQAWPVRRCVWATSASRATWTWPSPFAPASSRTARCTCRPLPVWSPILCPSWNGKKPNTRPAHCCVRPNWWRRGSMTRAIDKVKHCHTMAGCARRRESRWTTLLVPLLVERSGYMTQAATRQERRMRWCAMKPASRPSSTVARPIAEAEGGDPDLIGAPCTAP